MKKLEILTLRQYLSVNTQECHFQRQKFVFAKYPDVKILPIEPELPRDRDFWESPGFKIWNGFFFHTNCGKTSLRFLKNSKIIIRNLRFFPLFRDPENLDIFFYFFRRA